MKVTINGYQIECTPKEFLELTRELKTEGIAETQILPNDFNPLPDDIIVKGISSKPWFDEHRKTLREAERPKDFPPYLVYEI